MVICEDFLLGIVAIVVFVAKTLWELIEPIEKRMRDVREFLSDVCPELDINVVPINDPFGPTKSDPTMDLIVVSKETVKGGQKVNEGVCSTSDFVLCFLLFLKTYSTCSEWFTTFRSIRSGINRRTISKYTRRNQSQFKYNKNATSWHFVKTGY